MVNREAFAVSLLVLLLAPSVDSETRSAYSNLSRALGKCDDKQSLKAPGEVRMACQLGCQEHEAVLHETFEPWWDHQMPWQALLEACKMTGGRWSLAFLGIVVDQKVYSRCCSGGDCEASTVEGTGVTERSLLLSMIAEIAQEKVLPNMVFLYNIGDQPFTDKSYWSPVPQFHWVRSFGHWTIPIPNPFHLKAHVLNRLGDFSDHAARHVPWADRIPKVFWRGSLSAPDHLLAKDIATLPRIRLMDLAAKHPKLFDVGITSVDSEIYKVVRKAEVTALLKRYGGEVDHVVVSEVMPRYRYAINVAAVLSSWRLMEMLASGAVLVLQDNADHELALEWLTPWEHYVPVSQGLSNLVSTVEWLEAHPKDAEAIASRGFEVFTRRIRRQDTYCYIWQAWKALADAQTEPSSRELFKLLKKDTWTEAIDAAKETKKIPSYVSLQKLLTMADASQEL